MMPMIYGNCGFFPGLDYYKLKVDVSSSGGGEGGISIKRRSCVADQCYSLSATSKFKYCLKHEERECKCAHVHVCTCACASAWAQF